MAMIKNKKSIKSLKTKIYTITIGLALLVLVGGTWGYYQMVTARDNQRKVAIEACNAIAPITLSKDAEQMTATDAVSKSRLARINAIYDSLKLDSDYKLVSSNVFGDKRVYEWDSSRTFSSSKNYERCADVNNTVNELRKSIEAAGFKYFDEPYPGTADIQLHFKSDKNEYIRMSVYNAQNLNINNGPSSVILKVNLDDNNE